MGLVDTAKGDWQRFTSNPDEFGVSMTLETPAGSHTETIVGLATKHHIGIDTDGDLVNTKNAHISFSEKLLTDVGYPVRDGSGEVNLESHKVTVKDSTGLDKKYLIREWFQDETVGFIVCILGDYE